MKDNKELNQQQLRYNDNLTQASFSYWGAILAVNGLIFAFFSADLLKYNLQIQPLVIFVLFLNLLSIVLILYNFRKVRDLYYDLGGITMEEFQAMTEAQKREKKKNFIAQHNWRRKRESAIELLLILALLAVLANVLYSFFCI